MNACEIVYVLGFTLLSFCAIMTVIVLAHKERQEWAKERQELVARIQAGGTEMYLRGKMNLEQLEESKKQADHERAVELRGKRAQEEEPGEVL